MLLYGSVNFFMSFNSLLVSTQITSVFHLISIFFLSNHLIHPQLCSVFFFFLLFTVLSFYLSSLFLSKVSISHYFNINNKKIPQLLKRLTCREEMEKDFYKYHSLILWLFFLMQCESFLNIVKALDWQPSSKNKK